MTLDQNKSQSDFHEIKDTASFQVGSMLKELQEFEQAIKMENIPVIYRIYKGRLHNEINATANQHHEIDELLMQKMHDQFTAMFPFMTLISRPSATIQQYQMDQYYHERATIVLDASEPSVFILPSVEDEWLDYQKDQQAALRTIEKKMDELDARAITLNAEAEELSQEKTKILEAIQAKKEESKGFFGREKHSEELERMEQYSKSIDTKLTEVKQLLADQTTLATEKEALMQTYEHLRLKQAIITKEFRLITTYFGSFEEMTQQLEAFLRTYVNEEEGQYEI